MRQPQHISRTRIAWERGQAAQGVVRAPLFQKGPIGGGLMAGADGAGISDVGARHAIRSRHPGSSSQERSPPGRSSLSALDAHECTYLFSTGDITFLSNPPSHTAPPLPRD
jgi:hypothetical protein